MLFAGCIGTRHLKENERVLLRQRIEATENINREEMRDLFAQKENRKAFFVFAPLIEVYYWGERNYDPGKYVKKKEEVNAKFDRKVARTSSQKKINNYEFRRQKKLDRCL